MNKLSLASSLDHYPSYNNNNNNRLEDVNSATVYSDTSFCPTQLNYALPRSPDSYASTKTPLSPTTAMYNTDMSPLMMTPSPSLSLPTSMTASTVLASTYLIHDHTESTETQSTFYGDSFQQDNQILPHHYSYQDDTHQTQSNPRKKQRLQGSISSTTSQTGSPLIKTPSSTSTSSNQNKTKETTNTETGLYLKQEIPLISPTDPNQSTQETDDLASSHQSNNNGNNTTEIRRQIHIQSEQKRRAQIKCGFEELRNELPVCLNKKMSKVALLHRTVQHIQHLKSTEMTILTELERLVQENEQLKRFQQSVLQNQVMDSLYPLQ